MAEIKLSGELIAIIREHTDLVQAMREVLDDLESIYEEATSAERQMMRSPLLAARRNQAACEQRNFLFQAILEAEVV